MSFDLVMRTLGVLTCLYTVAYFVTTMSVAALNGVSYNSGPMCGPSGCVTVASKALGAALRVCHRRCTAVVGSDVPVHRLSGEQPKIANFTRSACHRPRSFVF